MIPVPIADPIFTMIDCRRSAGCTACSPTAMQFASLSTAAGTPKCSRSQAATGKRCQPGIRDGRVTAPACTSTGPGSEQPTPRSRSRPWRAASSSRVWASRGSAVSGPSAMTSGTVVTSVSSPPGRTTPMRAWRLPRSAATANSSRAPIRSTLRGRPPVEAWVPCSVTRPRSTSWPTVSEIVEGEAPSIPASSVREVPCPEAMSASTRSARDAGPLAPFRCAELTSGMGGLTSERTGGRR